MFLTTEVKSAEVKEEKKEEKKKPVLPVAVAETIIRGLLFNDEVCLSFRFSDPISISILFTTMRLDIRCTRHSASC